MLEPEPITRSDLVTVLVGYQDTLLERWLAATPLVLDEPLHPLSQQLLHVLLKQLGQDADAETEAPALLYELMTLADSAEGKLSACFSHLATLQQVVLNCASENAEGDLGVFVPLCQQVHGVIEKWRQIVASSSQNSASQAAAVHGFLQQLLAMNQSLYEYVCTAVQQVIGDTEAAVTELFSQQQLISDASGKLNADLQQFNLRSETLQNEVEANLQVITEASRAATQLPEQLRQERSQVEQLLKSVLGVAERAHMIKRISTDTRWLSLNAKIEAVRAGEFGKGFSVVADEIRTLSKDSLDASEQIQANLNTLNEITTNNFSEGFEEGLHAKENVLQDMDQATHQLGSAWQGMRGFYRDELSEALRDNIALADDIVAMLSSLQFQDIVRQKIERLTDLLNQHNDALTQLQMSLAQETGLDEPALQAIFTAMQSNLEQYAMEEQDHNSFDLGAGTGDNKIELF